ncbi:N-alpha-acetyltransferase 25, NatB auxiliary subunit, partial [Entomortierella beljakovae]
KGLEETERQYGDDYAIMASHLLIDIHKDTKSYVPLLNATFLLEHALSASKHNYQIKLVLIRVYELLGAFNCAALIYNTMSIKHVQHDTMSHFITDRASSFGLFHEALQLLYSAHEIYHSNETETPEMILQAYKYSTFSKMQEFIEFKLRLDNSLQKMIADRELIRLEFLKENSVKSAISWLQELETTNLSYNAQFCESRVDNRDTTVMLNWNPTGSLTVENLTRAAPQLGTAWLVLFTVIPCILKHMAHLSPINEEYDSLVATLEGLQPATSNGPSDPLRSELTVEESRLAQIIVQVSKAFKVLSVAIVAQNSNSPTKEEPAKTAGTIKEHYATANTLLKKHGSVKSTGVLPWQIFHGLALVIETVAYLNVVNQSMINLITTKANKKGTFKAANSAIQDFMGQCRQSLQAVITDITALKNVAKADRIKNGLLYEICDGSSIDFVRSNKHQAHIEDKTLKIGASWMAGLVNLQQEAESKMI